MINDQLLLESLHIFYSNEYNRDKLLSVLSSDKSISLRSIDWFITNYSKKNNICYLLYEKENNKYSFSEKNNKFLADVFNAKEVRDLGRFLDVIENQKQK